MRRIIGLVSAGVVAAPMLAFAQMSASQGVLGVLQLANRFFNGLVGLFITVAIVVFFWGLIKYLQSVGDDKAAGLKIMLMGVVTIFVMVSIWGLIALLQSTFGVQQNTARLPASVPLNVN